MKKHVSQINESSSADFGFYDFVTLDVPLDFYKPKFLHLWIENNNNNCANVGKILGSSWRMAMCSVSGSFYVIPASVK